MTREKPQFSLRNDPGQVRDRKALQDDLNDGINMMSEIEFLSKTIWSQISKFEHGEISEEWIRHNNT